MVGPWWPFLMNAFIGTAVFAVLFGVGWLRWRQGGDGRGEDPLD